MSVFAMSRSPVMALLTTGVYQVPPGGGACGPLPNIASFAMATSICTKVTLANMPACVTPASIPLSSADEAAATTGGGLVSARVKADCIALQFSTKVFFGNKGAVPMTSTTAHNAKNMIGGSILGPSQCKVTIG